LSRNRRQTAYDPAFAQEQYHRKKRKCGAKRKIVAGNELYGRIIGGLQLDWSPEQIVNTIACDVSLSTVYRAFHNKTLTPFAKHLRILTFSRGWRKGHRRGSYYKDAKTIHERPKEAWSRQDFGHWEIDTLTFSRKERKHLAVFAERKSRYLVTVLLDDKKAQTVKEAVIATFGKLPASARKTLTVDRGREFELWKQIEAALLSTRVYFCDPLKPQQKGMVENTNGLLRQYYPKRQHTQAASPATVAAVQARLNSRPRKNSTLQHLTKYFLLN
jgi:IS30 family transposase